MTKTLTISPDLATTADLSAVKTQLTAFEAKIAAVGNALTTLQAEVGVDETEIAALQAALPARPPARVTDLRVTAVDQFSATVAFTTVDDGTGQPASTYLRWAAGTITGGLSFDPGPRVGATRTVVVPNLVAGTAYQFQIVAYRGTLGVDAVLGAQSNVVSGTTSGLAA